MTVEPWTIHQHHLAKSAAVLGSAEFLVSLSRHRKYTGEESRIENRESSQESKF